MKTLFMLFLLAITVSSEAQIAINSDKSNADSSAILDIKSTEKGVLIPRMSTSQRNAISSPALGLIIFDTNKGTFWFNANSGWIALKSGNLDKLTDDDNDTKIKVEESNNENIIRFDVGGTEHFRMEEGRFIFSNNGQSVIIGVQAGENDNFNYNRNIFIGNRAGRGNISGRYNVALGPSALSQNSTGFYNTAIGENSIQSNNSAWYNTASGSSSLLNNTTGQYNVAMGHNSLYYTTGGSNIGIGYWAGFSNQEDADNVYIGTAAGRTNSGMGNVMIGHDAGRFMDSADVNVFLGNHAGEDESNANRLYIENSNSTSPLIYGEFDNELLRINGTLNINNAYSFPATDGVSGQLLQTDGSGVISWTTMAMTTGIIAMYPDSTPPAGWLICDGSTFDQATYPGLYALLGNDTLPDFSGRMPLGVGDSGTAGSTDHTLNSTGGEEMHTLTIDEMPAHSHEIQYREGEEQGSGLDYSDLGGTGVTDNTQLEGGGKAHNNMPPYYTLYFIIRAQ